MIDQLCIITFTEGRPISLNELEDCCDKRIIRNAIYELETILRVPSRRLDCIPPHIVRRNGEYIVYPGFWTGVAEIYLEDRLVKIIVKPRLKKYHVMVEKIENILGTWFWDILPPGATIPYIYPSTTILYHVRRLLTYIEWLVENEPHRKCFEQVSSRGYITGFKPEASVLTPIIKKLVCRPNTGLALILMLSMKAISEALHVIETQFDLQTPGLRDLIMFLTNDLRRKASSIYSEVVDFIEPILLKPGSEEEVMSYLDTLYIIEKLVNQGQWISRRGKGYVGLVMLPSTKLYELYILSILIEQLYMKQNCKHIFQDKEVRLHCNNKYYQIYFNNVPDKYSRIIKTLSNKTPKPDILVLTNDKAIVIEAKYRKLEDNASLRLSDAIRLTSYIADVATGTTRKALVVALDKPRTTHLEIPLDGVKADIIFLKANPDTDIDDIISYLK